MLGGMEFVYPSEQRVPHFDLEHGQFGELSVGHVSAAVVAAARLRLSIRCSLLNF